MTKEEKHPHIVMMQGVIGKPEDFDKMVYHYTSPEGLLGILNKEKIKLHFTKYVSLNDKSEGRVIKERYINICNKLFEDGQIDEEIKEILLKNVKTEVTQIFLKPGGEIEEFDSKNKFICSFSKKYDSLPMWNYYVKNGGYQGYCLGFKNLFEKCLTPIRAMNMNLSFVDIQYTEENLYDHILKCAREIKRRKDEKEPFHEIEYGIVAYIEKGALIHKQEYFEHENEMRLVLFADKEILEKMQYKTKNGALVPYIELEFDKTALKEIVIGPLMENELAKNNLEMFLKQYGYNEIEIKVSEAPIRY